VHPENEAHAHARLEVQGARLESDSDDAHQAASKHLFAQSLRNHFATIMSADGTPIQHLWIEVRQILGSHRDPRVRSAPLDVCVEPATVRDCIAAVSTSAAS